MKKIIFILILFLGNGLIFSQSKSDLAGIWKVVVEAGNKSTTPHYIKLNKDGTYIWDTDTSGKALDNATDGKWDVTADDEIKIIPDGIASSTMYYVKKGNNRYKYEYNENNGVKTLVYMLEMDTYLEKTGN